jgi:hypothetical protein
MTQRIGRLTLAIALIGVGAAILMDNLYGTDLIWFMARLWPGMLVLLGLEWLWASARSRETGAHPRTDGGAIALLIVVGIIAATTSAAQGVANRWVQFGPRVTVSVPEIHAPQIDVNIPPIPAISFGNTPAEITLGQDLNEADLKELLVTTSAASVTVTEGARPRVELRVRAWGNTQQNAENLARETQLKVEADNGRTRVRAVRNNNGRFDDEFFITLPRDMATALQVDTSSGLVTVGGHFGNVAVQTSSGSVRVERIGGDLDVRTSSGAITAQDIDGKLAATTSSGSIQADRVAGEVKANSTSGSVRVTGPRDKVVAQTSSGAISVATNEVNADYELSAGSGSVYLALTNNASVKLNARASSGTVTAPSWATIGEGRNSATGEVGGGDHEITIRTTSGSIAVSAPK